MADSLANMDSLITIIAQQKGIHLVAFLAICVMTYLKNKKQSSTELISGILSAHFSYEHCYEEVLL